MGFNSALAALQAGATTPTQQYQNYATGQAIQYGIDPTVFLRQLEQESGWNPNAVSSAGAKGIAQFTDATASDYGVNVNDPFSSIAGAAKYMSDLLTKYGGNYDAALTAYNAGPGNVDKYGVQGAKNLSGADPNYSAGILGNIQALFTKQTPEQIAATTHAKGNILGYPTGGDGPSITFSAGALVVGIGLLLVGVIWLAGYEITASGVAGAAVKEGKSNLPKLIGAAIA